MRIINSFLFTIFISVLFYLLTTSCANVVPPSGGPKDSIPPILLEVDPPNQSIRVKDKSFSFAFHERIFINNINQQLIITPRIEQDYDYKYSKYKLKINFKEPLPDSTTFTFNFRETVQDATEKNTWKENIYAFTTGDYLDSLQISGVVKDMITKDSTENITIGLYRIGDTTDIFTGAPYYFTLTTENGLFSINNIKNGEYVLRAYNDDNKNLMLESRNEKYAFIVDTLYLNQDLENILLELVYSNVDDITFNNTLSNQKYFQVNYNKPLKDYELMFEETDRTIFSHLVNESKSIRFYNHQELSPQDSFQVYITVHDSVSFEKTDTTWIRFNEARRKSETFEWKVLEENKKIDLLYENEITFNKPIKTFNKDSLLLKFDSTVIYRLSEREITWNFNNTALQLNFEIDKALVDTLFAKKRKYQDSIRVVQQQEKTIQDSLDAIAKKKDSIEQTQGSLLQQTKAGPSRIKGLQEKDKKAKEEEAESKPPTYADGLNLYLQNSAFISVEDDSTQTKILKISFIDKSKLGVIAGKSITEKENYFLQLVNQKGDVLAEHFDGEDFEFNNIQPGSYKIRAIVDVNNNKRWDAGNLKLNIPPEDIIYTQDEISVRANWEMDEILFYF